MHNRRGCGFVDIPSFFCLRPSWNVEPRAMAYHNAYYQGHRHHPLTLSLSYEAKRTVRPIIRTPINVKPHKREEQPEEQQQQQRQQRHNDGSAKQVVEFVQEHRHIHRR